MLESICRVGSSGGYLKGLSELVFVLGLECKGLVVSRVM